MRELNPGDKVVRGPDWSYGNQDRNYFDDPDTPQIGIVERRTQADWYRVKSTTPITPERPPCSRSSVALP